MYSYVFSRKACFTHQVKITVWIQKTETKQRISTIILENIYMSLFLIFDMIFSVNSKQNEMM